MIGSLHGVIAVHRCMQGRLDEAQQAFETRRVVLQEAKLGPITYVEEFDGLIAGYLATGRDRDVEAAEVLATANRHVSDARLSVWEGQVLLFECVRALVRLGRDGEAQAVRDRLAQLAASNVPPRAFLAWADGLLEPDPILARDHLAEAVARFETLGRRVDLGRCLLDLAEVEEQPENENGRLVERGWGLLESCGARLFLRDGAACRSALASVRRAADDPGTAPPRRASRKEAPGDRHRHPAR